MVSSSTSEMKSPVRISTSRSEEALFECALDLGIVAGEDLVETLNELDVERCAVKITVFGDLTGDLDARESGPADDDLGWLALSRLLAGGPDGLVDAAGVVQTLHRMGVLGEPVDAEEGSRAADADQQVVVLDSVAVSEFDRPLVGVDAGDAVPDEVRLRGFDLVDRNRDLRFDLRITNHAVGLVENEVVVVFRNPREFGLSRLDLVFERLDRASARIARTDDDNLICHV